MYISPYYEAAPPEAVQISALESPERPDTDEPDPNSIGEFAQMLAGLLRETQAEQIPQEEDGAADTVLLATHIEIPIEGETAGDAFSVPEQLTSLLSVNIDEITAIAALNEKAALSADDLSAEESIFAGLSEADENFPISPEMPLNHELRLTALDDADSLVEIEAAELAVEAGEESLPVFNQPGEADTAAALANAGSAAQANDKAQSNQKPVGEKDSNKNKTRLGEDAAFLDRREEAPIVTKTSEGKKGRLEELRGRERRGERLTVEVNDLRSAQAGERAELRVQAGLDRGPAAEGGTREITLELRLPDQAHKAPMSEANWATKSAHAFEDLLARELHQNFNNDIVRHASMILRDDNKGTIRLALKPDSLGNVKIRLEMAENKITGHIIVESEEALRAFEREIHSLEQAFKESGFTDASLNMSLAADGNGAEQFRQWAQAMPLLPESEAAARYDAHEQTEAPLARTLERGQTIINMLA